MASKITLIPIPVTWKPKEHGGEHPRKVLRGQTRKHCVSYFLSSYWLEPGHMTKTNCQEDWEM